MRDSAIGETIAEVATEQVASPSCVSFGAGFVKKLRWNLLDRYFKLQISEFRCHDPTGPPPSAREGTLSQDAWIGRPTKESARDKTVAETKQQVLWTTLFRRPRRRSNIERFLLDDICNVQSGEKNRVEC